MNRPRITPPAPKALQPEARAALLCAHAIELSGHCLIAIRHRDASTLADLQARKQIILDELNSLLSTLAGAASPVLHQSVGSLRTALREEERMLAESSVAIRSELTSLNGDQRRLTQAQRYDTAGQAPRGGQLSISG